MSKMSELHIEIQEMLLNGYDTDDIALMLTVPLDWVIQVAKDTGYMACQGSSNDYNIGEPL
jgi:uncharacterized protein (DUF488 family)